MLEVATDTGSADPQILCLGQKDFRSVWKLQQNCQKKLIQNNGLDTLIFCEHPTVITLGRQAERANILQPSQSLEHQGIEIIEIERGGDVTVHEIGQLVCYPIIDLAKKKRDVTWYMRSLEEVIIRTLSDFQVKGERISGKTGVWVKVADNSNEYKKIASIGVRISRWKTLHGFALNVSNQLEAFKLIHPCGIVDAKATSLAKECDLKIMTLDASNREDPVVKSLTTNFLKIFY